jgi:tetratricopeptide (TPR) repeat protein
LRKPESALEHFQQALDLLVPIEHTEKTRAEILLRAANALSDTRHPADAHQRLGAALELMAGIQEARALKGQILFEFAATMDADTPGQQAEATRTYREALGLLDEAEADEESRVGYLDRFADFLRNAGKDGEAVQVYRDEFARLKSKGNDLHKDRPLPARRWPFIRGAGRISGDPG